MITTVRSAVKKNHDSRECIAKLKENVKIVPTYCNCGESNNANSLHCKKRPQENCHNNSGDKASEPTTTNHAQALKGSEPDNARQRRFEQRQLAVQASIPVNVTDRAGHFRTSVRTSAPADHQTRCGGPKCGKVFKSAEVIDTERRHFKSVPPHLHCGERRYFKSVPPHLRQVQKGEILNSYFRT
ncbi:hypothetical protein E2C01_067861 [Portunus trituberculatus]|uniref:Uncharacterized protein n=1 Tax=Portunus trituberculatus TaxID=210409 RepID=A0A5B7HWA5_PORTR|nr:hypothetical protein [Portunus trituberculatus]